MTGESDANVSPAASVTQSSTMDTTAPPTVEDKSLEGKKETTKKKKGLMSRMWNGLFGSRKDDFEKLLERISKEEAVILTRMRRRAQNWGRMKRHLIIFSIILEVVAVGYAIMTARTAEHWKIRAMRVLPMFLLPAVSSVTYSAFASFINMCERKDKKTLEKLREERQSKIDELKEKTNYYITQQLIQRYDTDPAAKAAAATILASKLGADSGLKVFLGDEHNSNAPTGKSSDVELMPSDGLRNRKQPQANTTSPGGTMQRSSESSPPADGEYAEHNQLLFVDHYQPQGSTTAYNNGWLSRIAAVLVGEDPTQCYALICGNCHMHNGLASKEDFPYVTYICPHCHAVNGPKIRQEHGFGANSSNTGSSIVMDEVNASDADVSSQNNEADNSNLDTTPLTTKEQTESEVSAVGKEG